MKWTLGDTPPVGVETWCIVEGAPDGEPYLVRGTQVASGFGVTHADPETWDRMKTTNYLPPNHRIVAWRRA